VPQNSLDRIPKVRQPATKARVSGRLAAGVIALALGVHTHAHAQTCGRTISGTTTLVADLVCSGNGLVLDDRAALDCNGHTIRGRSDPADPTDGISADGASNVSIRNCTVKNFDTGIRLVNATNAFVKDNYTENNSTYGIEITRDSTGALIEGNHVLNNGDEGIHISGPFGRDSDHSILGNEIRDNATEGIYMLGSDGNIVAGNDIANHGAAGIYATDHNGDVAEGNVIEANTLWNDRIQLESGSRLNIVAGNTISKTGRGVQIVGDENTITQNIVANANINGIQIEGNDNTITENTITGAATSGISIDGVNNAISCNQVTGNEIGLQFGADATPNTVHLNVIVGNVTGLDARSVTTAIAATENWWGCAEGPGPAFPECDSALGNVDASLPLTSEPPDSDADGAGDVCDTCTDTDGDGFGDPGFTASKCLRDNCPNVPNSGQDDQDGDGIGDLCDECTDTDGDGFGDPSFAASTCLPDNCRAVANPAQEDADRDGFGDPCDPCTDTDHDGFSDPGFPGSICPVDNCHRIPNPDQLDIDGNDVGEACECTAPAPGYCIAGGGNKNTDCLVEFNTAGPITLSRTRRWVKRVLRCHDGDLRCDRDGLADGLCTFGVSVCIGNTDPRLPHCRPAAVHSFEVVRPNANRTKSNVSRDNALRLEQGLRGLGVGIQRRGKLVVDALASPPTVNSCSPFVDLIVPAPKGNRAKTITKKFKMRGHTADGRGDKDILVLKCKRPL
jgi:parallel beta-helix repeat protein